MTAEVKTEKSLEQRISELEAKLTDEALIKRIDPIVCGLIAVHAADIVKIGVKDIVVDAGKTIVRPFTWIYEKVSGAFEAKPEVKAPVATTA